MLSRSALRRVAEDLHENNGRGAIRSELADLAVAYLIADDAREKWTAEWERLLAENGALSREISALRARFPPSSG